MAYTLEQIEYLHDTGKIPDWIYYQMNGKSLQENYATIKRKQHQENMKLLEERYRKQQQEKEQRELEAEIEKKAEKAIEKALDELLKDFGK